MIRVAGSAEIAVVDCGDDAGVRVPKLPMPAFPGFLSSSIQSDQNAGDAFSSKQPPHASKLRAMSPAEDQVSTQHQPWPNALRHLCTQRHSCH